MSASPVFSSAALGRPFLFLADGPLQQRLIAMPKLSATVTPASRLEVRPAPEMVSSGIWELDALTGGLPRGCLTEICGSASSGRTGILLAAMARTTQRGEVCALVDASDALDPASAVSAGVEMGRLLWVRCREKNSPRRYGDTERSWEELSKRAESTVRNNKRRAVFSTEEAEMAFSVSPCLRGEERRVPESQLEQVLRVTDLLLQSNGFGMIALDLGDIPLRSARRIPLASWFRFRRAVEHTPTVLVVLEQQPIAGSCSSVLLKVTAARSRSSGKKFPARNIQGSASEPMQAELLDEFEIEVELLRSRLERKPMQSVTVNFHSRAAWAG